MLMYKTNLEINKAVSSLLQLLSVWRKLGILITLLLPSFLVQSLEPKTEYYSYGAKTNLNLEICTDFKQYLEKHANNALYCGLVEDVDFPDIKLPKLTPAPEGLGTRLFVQKRLLSSDVGAWPKKREHFVKKMDQGLKAAKDFDFYVSKFDINNDGDIDPVLVFRSDKGCEKYRLAGGGALPYERYGNIDSSFITNGLYGNWNGYPFYYKGRTFFLSGSENYYFINEPRNGQGHKIITTKNICIYERN